MDKPGQIHQLMSAATQSLAGLRRRGDSDARKSRVDQTLARYRIFTESTVQKCTVDSGPEDDEDAIPTVYVSVDVRFTAPDGSFSIVRSIGEAAGHFLDASVEASESARWHAIFTCLDFDATEDIAA